MSGRESKAYGLIIRKKPTSTPIKLSIFGNDSSSDEEEKGRKIVNNTIKKEAEKNKQMRQTQIEMAKVLEEDPTAYDYDKVYDKMTESKANLVAAKKATAEKKPKYIGNLLKYAEVRKKEEERRVERQVQKEREDEGNEFADKDAFVTSAYRRKMQEMAEDEERQRRLDELEGDVTKQADLSMFYRNLLDKNLSTTGTHNSEDQSTTDETHRAADVESTKNERNKSSEKVERSKNNDKRENVDEDDRERKRKGRSRQDHEKRESSERHRTVSDKSEKFREKDEPQRRKPSPETHTRREKEKRLDEENTSPREVKRAEDRQETSRDEGGQDEKKEQMEKRENNDKIKTTGEKRGFNEHKSDERRNDDKDTSKGHHEQSKFAKHSSTETVLSARERYLARKNARVVVKATSDDENE